MENLNLVELLRDCPNGMELDSTVFDNITFDYVNTQQNRVYCKVGKSESVWFTPKGGVNLLPYAKCVIFPKGKTTWEGFVPPYKFKDGDILFVDCSDDEENKSYQYIFILNNPKKYGKWHSYCHLYGFTNFHSKETYLTDEAYQPRLATEEEKQRLFDAIKANGYKWNAETKTLVKLPKFKVGDRIKEKEGKKIAIVERVYKDYYDIRFDINNGIGAFTFNLQDKWELVSDKFDITYLIPFESRVLVRDYDNRMWMPTFWGKRLEDDSNCSYLTSCYKYCIPYEGNKHLLGTTNDCDGYFKIWENNN